MTKIKICGLTSTADAEIVNELKVDYAGIVMFFPKSKRNTAPEDAKKIIAALDSGIRSVAVVVSPTAEQIKVIEDCGFDIIQIHGEAPDEIYRSSKRPIFKAFNVRDLNSLERYAAFDQVTGYVFDAAQPGSGKTFDWTVLKAIPRDGKLVILAGGLTPGNVAQAIEFLRPDVVDVSSGVENDGGNGKSRDKARQFVTAVRTV